MKNFFCIFQPYLLAVTPLVVLFRNNPGEVFYFDFFVVLICLAIIIFLLSYLVFKGTKDLEKTSISMSILWLSLIISAELSSVSPSLIWGLCALGACLSLKISFSSRWKSVLSFGFTLPLLFVTCYTFIEIFFIKINIQNEICRYASKEIPKQACDISCSRNVFIIILDEFISEQSFKQYYHYNNDLFFDYLREKNFHIVPHSTSNYPWTITSLSSILNFDYLRTDLSKNYFTGVAQFLIEHNMLFQIFKNEGYCIHHIPSIYWMGNPAQGYFSDFWWRIKSYGFIQTLFQITPWKNFYRTYQRHSHRQHVLYQLNQIKVLSEKPGKNVIFAHIMCPHRPIAFTEDGQVLSRQEEILSEKDEKHHFYLRQAKFLSGEIIRTVDYILSHSLEAPIIFILSDHGKFPIGSHPKGKESLPLNEIAWRFSNLQALYLPGFHQTLPDNITPVNTLRILLNHYFGYEFSQIENAVCPHFFNFNQRIPNQSILNTLRPQEQISCVQ